MTADEFRDFVDRYSHEKTAIARIRDVAETFGWGWHRIHAYYYGERRVPLHIATIIRPNLKSRRAASTMQTNAALLLVRNEFERLEEHVAAVARMCAECESSGECKLPSCPLRAVSPLPLARGAVA